MFFINHNELMSLESNKSCCGKSKNNSAITKKCTGGRAFPEGLDSFYLSMDFHDFYFTVI